MFAITSTMVGRFGNFARNFPGDAGARHGCGTWQWLCSGRRVRILVVTPDSQLAQDLAEEFDVPVDVCADFVSARQKLVTGGYGLMFTEVRLGAYNGLQLAYLAKQLQLPTRVVVFTSPFDKFLATETVSAGAFYEHAHKVVAAARSYLGASLPDQDRRDPSSFQPHYAETGMRAADRH